MQLTNLFHRQFADTTRSIRTVMAGYWRVIVAIALSLIMVRGIMALTHPSIQQVFTCASEESMLVYPLYDRRGTVTDHRTLCAPPHRGCIRRSETSNVYDCSPFMAPDTLWAGGGVLLN